jgi:hypothetical protein
MRLRIWTRFAAVAAAAVALAGSAAAQPISRSPIIIPQAPAAAPAQLPAAAAPAQLPAAAPTRVPAAAAQAPAAAPAPAPVAVTPAPAAGPAVVAGQGGCSNCNTAARGFVMSASGGYFGTSCRTGLSCNNGCGSFRSDLGFVLGSCKSFFAPCGPGLLGHNCNHPVLGTGRTAPTDPCVYDSYLNR